MAALVLLLVAAAFVKPAAAPNMLVVLDDPAAAGRASHSQFFALLEAQGHTLSFASAEDAALADAPGGAWKYDALVFAAPKGATASLATAAVAFVDAGHSVLLVGGSGGGGAGAATRQLALELGIEFDAAERLVIDHAAFDRNDVSFGDDHTLIVADGLVTSPVVVGEVAKPLLYRGVGMRRRGENELVVGVLTSTTAYSWTTRDEVDSKLFASGEELLLVASMQARNGARAIAAGSWEMFSDAFFGAEVRKFYAKSAAPSGNRDFADAVTKWLYGNGGTLRVSNIAHDLQRGDEADEQAADTYTTKDVVSYGFTLEELDGSDEWVPFIRDDVQMEFTMLDPYYRLDVPHVGTGRYNVTFMVPDVPGVFSFNLDFHRGVNTQAIPHRNLISGDAPDKM